MHCCKGILRPWENSWSVQDHCLWYSSCLAEAGRSLQGAGRAGSLQEQMPGLWRLLLLHSLRPRRWMAPSQSAGLPVLCFLWNNKKHLNPQAHHMSQRQERLEHTHLCASTAHVSPVVPWLVREKSSHIESQLPCPCVSAFLQPTSAQSQIWFSISISFKFINPGETPCRSKVVGGWEIDRFTGL